MKMIRSPFALTLTLAALASACGGSVGQPPPVARPSVSLERTRVALGGALPVTYRFQVAPDARFAADYRVMVHVLDANEELLWTEDHDPPIPTREWKPGQTVEYSLTHFVPVYPYVGEAMITVGLYATESGERLPLSGQDTGQREYVVSRIQLLPQTESVLMVFKDGWHPAERATHDPTIEWQWSKKDGTWSFRNPRQNATFYLHYSGAPAMFDRPQTVTLYLQDQVVGSFTVQTTDDEIRAIVLKAAQFGSDDMAQLRLSVDQTFVPDQRKPGSGDPRELGLRVIHAVLEPQ